MAHQSPNRAGVHSLSLALTDQQQAALRAAADRAGLTVEAMATSAVRAALAQRYTLPRTPGSVAPLQVQALKRPEGRSKT